MAGGYRSVSASVCSERRATWLGLGRPGTTGGLPETLPESWWRVTVVCDVSAAHQGGVGVKLEL